MHYHSFKNRQLRQEDHKFISLRYSLRHQKLKEGQMERKEDGREEMLSRDWKDDSDSIG